LVGLPSKGEEKERLWVSETIMMLDVGCLPIFFNKETSSESIDFIEKKISKLISWGLFCSLRLLNSLF